MTDSRNTAPRILGDRSERRATRLGRQPSDQRAGFGALSRAALGKHGMNCHRVAVADVRCDVFEPRLLAPAGLDLHERTNEVFFADHPRVCLATVEQILVPIIAPILDKTREALARRSYSLRE